MTCSWITQVIRVMPGALIIESLAQLGGVPIEATMRGRGRDDLRAPTMVDRARFAKWCAPAIASN